MSENTSFRPVHESTMLLREILRLSEVFDHYMAAELTVNQTDLQAMEHLIQRGAMSPTELAKALGLSTAAATVVVDRLAKVGHVSRQPHPTDRRGVQIVPAEASVQRAIERLMPMISGIDQIIHRFTPEQQETITLYLRDVVRTYADSIPAEHHPAPPPASRRTPNG